MINKHIEQLEAGMHKTPSELFWCPSTRYKGILDPLRGEFSIAGFWSEGGGQLQGFRWTSDSCILGWSCFIWMMPEVIQLNVFQLEYKMTIGLPRSHPLTLINHKILELEVHFPPVFTFTVITFFYEIFSLSYVLL